MGSFFVENSGNVRGTVIGHYNYPKTTTLQTTERLSCYIGKRSLYVAHGENAARKSNHCKEIRDIHGKGWNNRGRFTKAKTSRVERLKAAKQVRKEATEG